MRDLMSLAFVAFTAGLSASTALADPASDLSGKSARMLRPQAVLDTTLSDESAGSGLLAAKPGGKASVSGFDVLKANATLSAPTNPVIQDLSSQNTKMQRPQAVLDTALSDGANARMMRPQAVLDTTLSDGSANARMMRPQAVLDMTLSDGSTGSADMAAKPSKQPQAPVSGFDIVKADEALQNSPQSRFNLSAVNYGSRGGLEREDLRSK